jgi:hypothetical protein
MPQLFARRSTAWIGLALCGAAGLLIGGPLLLIAWVRTPYVTAQFIQRSQPVDFDHRHHVSDDHIDCLYCHTDAERGPYAGVPPADLCLNCHSQVWLGSAALAPIWRSHAEARPIAWQRVTYLPDFVYFNHAIHVRKSVGCETCHGRVDLMARVYQTAPLTMAWCLDCHRDPGRYLRPREDVTVMGYIPASPQRFLGLALMRAYGVRSLTTCTTCHR